ncbi:MAG TPA: ATP-binding protein [Anseongella sp.]
MDIERALYDIILGKRKVNKVQVIVGPRRVGKTVLLQKIANSIKEKVLLLNGEDITTSELLERRSIENYRRLLNDYQVLMIDEAQAIPEIGKILKLIVDEIKGIEIFITGSSAFDLKNRLGEPLTGRQFTYHLFPLAQMELSHHENLIETKARLEERLIFGSYPELLDYPAEKDKVAYLNEVVSSYLLKDILTLDGLRNTGKLHDLLKLIALQLGSEVSMDELGKQLSMSKNTVESYLDLLTKVFVIYKAPGFSRNLRKEVRKSSKWYFTDNGIRNILISNTNPLKYRNDQGDLWENYLLGERVKYQAYTRMLSNNYFWRTYDQQEIDWIEDRNGTLNAYEIKWKTGKKVKPPIAWQKGYPDATFKVIDPENYLDWIM